MEIDGRQAMCFKCKCIRMSFDAHKSSEDFYYMGPGSDYAKLCETCQHTAPQHRGRVEGACSKYYPAGPKDYDGFICEKCKRS